MRFRLPRTRFFQVTVLILLIFSAVQVFWWIMDQSRRTADLRERLTALYASDAVAAGELRRLGASKAKIEELFPHLDIDPSGEFVVAPEVTEGLRKDRAKWLNQYSWEGAFFLVVLAVSMAAVWRALHEESVLRKRQRNFVAAVSHELKSPLAGMQLSVETLGLRECSPERSRQLLDRIAADIARMMDMITKILDAARLDQRRIGLSPEAVTLLPMVERVLDELESRCKGSCVRVEVEVDPELEVLADPIGVGAVLRNLLDNALRSIEEQGGGEILVQGEVVDGFARLTVQDDGLGFDPKESKLLFDKFYRPGDELRRKGPGQGLGLYIAKRFVELEKGRIRAFSEGAGQGATFEVSWPVVVRKATS